MSAARTPDSPAATRGGEQSSALLTVDQLAERWSVPPSHVYRLARDGRLPTVRLGRYRRWRLEDVDAFERAGGCTE